MINDLTQYPTYSSLYKALYNPKSINEINRKKVVQLLKNDNRKFPRLRSFGFADSIKANLFPDSYMANNDGGSSARYSEIDEDRVFDWKTGETLYITSDGELVGSEDDVYKNGGNLPYFAKSGIHIDPKNKGKFTETKKRTGKTTEELTHSKNPLTRKRAIFAQNAKKWKHQEGGSLRGNILGWDVPLWAEIGASFLPFIGTAMDVKQAIEDPTLENIGGAALSLGADLVGASLVKGGFKITRGVDKIHKLEKKIKQLRRTAGVTEDYSRLIKAQNELDYLKKLHGFEYGTDAASDMFWGIGKYVIPGIEYYRNGLNSIDRYKEVKYKKDDSNKKEKHFLGGSFQGIATDNGFMVSKDKKVSKSKPKIKLIKKVGEHLDKIHEYSTNN